jgi:sugar lactone lactonase YvrE
LSISGSRSQPLASGLDFPESPRWHGGRFGFVDMFGHRAHSVGIGGGDLRTEAEFGERPSGLGFLPDGTPVVVLMESRKVVRLDAGQSLHADLGGLAGTHLNDMVVDGSGRAYVDCVKPRPSFESRGDIGDMIVLIEPDGTYRTAAQGDVIRPNGLAISADGRTLVAAESLARRLTAFEIQEDGSLGPRRRFAETFPRSPDGICLDSEGAVWYGSPRTGEFVRVLDGGEVTDVIQTEGRWAIACVTGGPERDQLLMVTSVVPNEPSLANLSQSRGAAEIARIKVPGGGVP